MKISGAEAVARTLARLEVEFAFNVPGFGLQPLVDALDHHRTEIRYVSSVNETNIALVANGYARASGRPAFLSVYHASGTALAMMGVTTAWADNVPMVIASTTAARSVSGRDPYAAIPRQATDMTEQFTKWSFEIPSAERIPEILSRAFAIAATPPMGPVHLAFPLDLYTSMVDDEVLESVRPLSVPQPGAAEPRAVQQAAEVLGRGRDVVMVLGSEVAQYGAVDAAIRLAEATGATVLMEQFPSRFPFPTTHQQYVGKVSDFPDIPLEADVLLYVGCELTEQRGPGQNLLVGTGATRIFLSVDPQLTTKFFTPDISLTGAPSLTLSALADAVSSTDSDGPTTAIAPRPTHYIERRRLARDRRQALLDDGFHDSPLRAARVIHELAALGGGECAVVNQAGTAAVLAETLWDFGNPELYFGISAKASAQGWALPAAIGVSLCKPERPVIVLVGDGGFMFSATAIYTAANLKSRIVFVVVRNGGWQDISASSRAIGGESHIRESEYGWTFDSPEIDFVGLAVSLGVPAVRASTPEDLHVQLKNAMEAHGPVVLVADCDPADVDFFFRKAQ